MRFGSAPSPKPAEKTPTGADGQPLVYPVPLLVRNTFIHAPDRPASLDGFLFERLVRSCPASGVELVGAGSTKEAAAGDVSAQVPASPHTTRSEGEGSACSTADTPRAALACPKQGSPSAITSDFFGDLTSTWVGSSASGSFVAAPQEPVGAASVAAQQWQGSVPVLRLADALPGRPPLPELGQGGTVFTPGATEWAGLGASQGQAPPQQHQRASHQAVYQTEQEQPQQPQQQWLPSEEYFVSSSVDRDFLHWQTPRQGLAQPELPPEMVFRQMSHAPMAESHVHGDFSVLDVAGYQSAGFVVAGSVLGQEPGQIITAECGQAPTPVPVLRPPPPTATVPPLASIGSATHNDGVCKPCAFLHTKGCENGTECNFCHLCEPGEKKKRRKDKLQMRSTMRQLKKLVPESWGLGSRRSSS